ncbi:MAG: hypothetical protein Q9216_001589 [Gyalolechia sp. 2 TL-2023]
MLSGSVRTAASLVFGGMLCTVLTFPTSEGSLVAIPAPLINISSPIDTNPSTSSNDIQIECRGSQYGTHIRYASCLDAFGTFKNGGTSNPVRIGLRKTGTNYAQNLPWKWA